MKSRTRETTQLGDLVVAAFDGAAQYATGPEEISRLATRVVAHMLRLARRTLAVPPRASAARLRSPRLAHAVRC